MHTLVASALLPLRRRLDWGRARLSYVPERAYEGRETRRMSLLRRFALQFRRYGRRLI